MLYEPRKLVCVFAHPDDEAFGPGGSIAYFAQKGVEVSVICATCGDAEARYSLHKESGESLGKIRKKELEASAKILGVKRVFFLNYKDGALCNNNYHDVANDVKKILDTMRPDTILTFDINGVSGHLDHIAVAMECTYLFERLKYIKSIWYFCSGKLEKKLIGKKYFVYFPDGIDRSQADVVIDVKRYFPIKKNAMLAHKSQRTDAMWFLILFKKLVKEELFRIKLK